MTREDELDLVHIIARRRRFDWSPEVVRAVIRRTVMEYGATRSMEEICMAALHCAGNPLNEHPSVIYGRGPHWDALPDYLARGADTAKRYKSRRDREILEDAAASQAARDPEASRRGYLAASAALKRTTTPAAG
jgi:hypothetical protein